MSHALTAKATEISGGMTGAPEGLGLSLDDLIKRSRGSQPAGGRGDAGRGRGTGRGQYGAGGGSGHKAFQDRQPVQGGGVQKKANTNNRGGYQNYGNGNSQRGGYGAGQQPRSSYQPNRGGFGQQQGGRGPPQQQQGQFQQQHIQYKQQQQGQGHFKRPEQGQGQQGQFKPQQQGSFGSQQIQKSSRPYQQQQQGREHQMVQPYQQQQVMQLPAQSMMEDDAMDSAGGMQVSQEDNGTVVASIDGIAVVTVTPDGEVTLNTDGWYDADTLQCMNEVLTCINIKVAASGPPEHGHWQVADGYSLGRYTDGMKLSPKGPFAHMRGQTILNNYMSPASASLALAATAASNAAALRGMGTGPASMRGMGGLQDGLAGMQGMGRVQSGLAELQSMSSLQGLGGGAGLSAASLRAMASQGMGMGGQGMSDDTRRRHAQGRM